VKYAQDIGRDPDFGCMCSLPTGGGLHLNDVRRMSLAKLHALVSTEMQVFKDWCMCAAHRNVSHPHEMQMNCYARWLELEAMATCFGVEASAVGFSDISSAESHPQFAAILSEVVDLFRSTLTMRDEAIAIGGKIVFSKAYRGSGRNPDTCNHGANKGKDMILLRHSSAFRNKESGNKAACSCCLSQAGGEEISDVGDSLNATEREVFESSERLSIHFREGPGKWARTEGVYDSSLNFIIITQGREYTEEEEIVESALKSDPRYTFITTDAADVLNDEGEWIGDPTVLARIERGTVEAVSDDGIARDGDFLVTDWPAEQSRTITKVLRFGLRQRAHWIQVKVAGACTEWCFAPYMPTDEYKVSLLQSPSGKTTEA